MGKVWVVAWNRRATIRRALVALGLATAGVLAFWAATRPPEPAAATLRLGTTGDGAGFARALEPRGFQFPVDHGPHLDFQTEWWYYTGNLTTSEGDHLGYQLTFFRRGLSPTAPRRASAFGTNQIYFAHLALTDVAGREHTSFERFSRGAAGLAGARGEPFAVWIEDWRAEALDAAGSVVRLTAAQDGLVLELTLEATKAIVAHGDAGLSRKSDVPGNASYYLSFTRLATTGRITLPDRGPIEVSGESWFDHEWSTSALGAGAVGWDWFSLQLGDGQELMYFQIRRDDGSLEPVSGGTLVASDGSVRRLAAADVRIDVLSEWRSPASGSTYPSTWRVRVPAAEIDLRVEPWIADQEMDVSFVYWEGAVRLAGSSQGRAVEGVGYVELTGYASSIAGQF
jgi:predicted secreted hydrolase